MRRRWVPVGLLAVVLLAFLTACGGGGAVRQQSWPGLTLAEDTLYVANVDRLQAFDPETGDLLWTYPAEGDAKIGFYSTPVLAEEDDLLLTQGFGDMRVYAFRLGGSPSDVPGLAWVFPQSQEQNGGAKGQYVAHGTVAGSLYLIGNGDGTLYALNLADGELAWSFQTGDRIWAAPLVIEDTVYISSLDHTLYALSVVDGTERWRLEMQGAIAMSPVAVDGKVFVGDFGDRIYQIDPETGKVLWTFEDGVDWFWATPTVGEAAIYFVDVQGNVFAFDRTSLDLLWQAQVKDVVRGQSVLSADETLLYVPGYERGLIYVLETETGEKIPWGELPATPGRIPGDLVADAERVYAMPILIEDRLQAFSADNGKLLWQYPPKAE